jgi:hypothetical protein
LCIRKRNLAFLPLCGFRAFLAQRGSSSLGQMRNGALLFRGFRTLLMFSRAARRCFDDAIFVTPISSLDLTLRYRATAQQQTGEIQIID